MRGDGRNLIRCNSLSEVSDGHGQRRNAHALIASVITLATVMVVVLGHVDNDRDIVAAADTTADTEAAAPAVGSPSRYVAINPIRVIDTRTDPTRRRLPANGSLTIAPVTVDVSNASVVAASNVHAVVLNVTMVDAGGAGFATVWPTGSPQPTVSSTNTDFVGQTVPNMVTVPLGVDGSISLFSSVAADFIIDVQGVYEAATSATSGRLVPVNPSRAIDTRQGGTLGANSTITVDLAPFGVPTSASAAVLNVTATETAGAGYFTVWPADTAIPLASNLNVPGPGYNVANQVIARVTNGRVSVYSEVGGDVLVDVTGYITGASEPASTEGLFVPLTPDRLLDTRTRGAFSSGVPLVDGGTLTLPVNGRGGVPASGVQSVALNVTATRTLAFGYVTSWPGFTPMPPTSTLNFVEPGRTVPNHAVVRVGNGAAAFFSSGGTDLLVDVFGYWTGSTPGTAVGEYAFLYQSDPKSITKPYGRWNPCSPIRVAVRTDAASADLLAVMRTAISEAEAATGFDLVEVGFTTEDGLSGVPSGADAVIGFSTQSTTPELAGGTIGIGGGSYDPASGQVSTGFAIADLADVRPRSGLSAADSLRATFKHEIAHMLGLDHVEDEKQLMFSFSTSNTDYQSGDLAGLYLVGAQQPCFASARLSDSPGDVGTPGSDTHPADTVLVVAT